MQQPYVSTLIEQDFSDEEKSRARENISALSSADLGPYATKSWVSDNFLSDADFRDFATHEEVESATSGKQDKLTAGPNIDIYENIISTEKPRVEAGTNVSVNGVLDPQTRVITYTISATDTTYSAGSGLSLNDTTFNVDKPIPNYNSGDYGKVLGINSSGALDWVNQSSGATYSAGQYISIDQNNVITASGLQPQLPSAQEDQYLTTNASGQLQWEDKLIGVPPYTNLNRGQVLGLNYSSQLYWRNTYKRTVGEGVGHEWTAADDATGYVDMSVSLNLPDYEYTVFFSVEISNLRATYGETVASFAGAIDRIELFVGNSSNPTLVKFGKIDVSSTGTNGYGASDGGSWLMSHYRGTLLAQVDRITLRLYKITGATVTGYNTSVGINQVEFA